VSVSAEAQEWQRIIRASVHTRTKARSPQTNGICERFHQTVLNEFYRVAFRKKLYTTLEQLQARPRRLATGVQRAAAASEPLVLQEDPDADVPGQRAVGEGEAAGGRETVTCTRTPRRPSIACQIESQLLQLSHPLHDILRAPDHSGEK
jgi:hypothetical protein